MAFRSISLPVSKSWITLSGSVTRRLVGVVPGPPTEESEDCLNLNAYAPESAEECSKAVLFWIHGGSFSFGAGSLPIYGGSSIAANHDVVVVTVNYRTNVFGFPGPTDLPEGERNLGFLDKHLALDWVYRNIGALGGVPEKVTIVGESAGGGSVDTLVTAPPNPVPFRAAIMQSGQATITNLKNPKELWDKVVKAFDCSSDDSLECIRAVPALELKEMVERQMLDFGPMPDNSATFANTRRANRLNSIAQKSLIARVPVLIGSNAGEGATYSRGLNDTEQFIRSQFGEFATDEVVQTLLKAYPIGSPGISSDSDRISAIVMEYVFQCSARIVAEESALVDIDSWRYYFNGSFPNAQLFQGSGVYHSSEIKSVFRTYKEEGAAEFQVEASKAMQDAWAKFAKAPNSGPGWDPVRRVGVFGGGARPGLDDAGREALVTLDPTDLDKRCALYNKPVYDTAK